MKTLREVLRKFPPLGANHPLVRDKTPCAACDLPFWEGEVVTLVPIGPGPDAEQSRLAREGKTYNALSVPVHWKCATGEEP